MKESFRRFLPDIREGWTLVFVATRKAEPELKRQDFDEDLRRLLKEAKLIEKNNKPID